MRPELDVSSGPLLQRAGADDVGDRQPPAGPKDARRLAEEPALDGREVDDPVRDHDVEALVLERKVVDARLRELDLRKAFAVSEPGGLCDLLVGEVDTHRPTGLADLDRS